MATLKSRKRNYAIEELVLSDQNNQGDPVRAWCTFLAANLEFPFVARCNLPSDDWRPLSVLTAVLRIAAFDAKDDQIYVRIHVGQESRRIPLYGIECVDQSSNARFIEAWSRWYESYLEVK